MTANLLKANWNQFLPKGSYRPRVIARTLRGGNPMKQSKWQRHQARLARNTWAYLNACSLKEAKSIELRKSVDLPVCFHTFWLKSHSTSYIQNMVIGVEVTAEVMHYLYIMVYLHLGIYATLISSVYSWLIIYFRSQSIQITLEHETGQQTASLQAPNDIHYLIDLWNIFCGLLYSLVRLHTYDVEW
jgi:hypothetical protein